ncbi:MAG: phosphatase PAP2 family protein [Tepidisphaeraceae bacterium]
MIVRLWNILEWLGGHGWVVIGASLLVVSGTWGFIKLSSEVEEGETQQFDEWAVRALRQKQDPSKPIGPAWMAEVGRDITALGGVAVLTLATLAVAGFLALNRKYHAMLLVLVATGGGLALSSMLKGFFDRGRPELVPHLSHVYTSSFPSGHSMLAAVVYLTLGSLLTGLTRERTSKIYFLAVALVLTFLIGASRVYMGVHYPTDVLAGWTAGLVWAMLCWLVARWLRRRGAVEQVDTPETSRDLGIETKS